MIALAKSMKPTEMASCSAGICTKIPRTIAAIRTKQPAVMKPLRKEKSLRDTKAYPDKPKKIKAVPPSAVVTIWLPPEVDISMPIRGPVP